jgi:hypothetical protein
LHAPFRRTSAPPPPPTTEKHHPPFSAAQKINSTRTIFYIRVPYVVIAENVQKEKTVYVIET